MKICNFYPDVPEDKILRSDLEVGLMDVYHPFPWKCGDPLRIRGFIDFPRRVEQIGIEDGQIVVRDVEYQDVEFVCDPHELKEIK